MLRTKRKPGLSKSYKFSEKYQGGLGVIKRFMLKVFLKNWDFIWRIPNIFPESSLLWLWLLIVDLIIIWLWMWLFIVIVYFDCDCLLLMVFVYCSCDCGGQRKEGCKDWDGQSMIVPPRKQPQCHFRPRAVKLSV